MLRRLHKLGAFMRDLARLGWVLFPKKEVFDLKPECDRLFILTIRRSGHMQKVSSSFVKMATNGGVGGSLKVGHGRESLQTLCHISLCPHLRSSLSSQHVSLE